MYLLPNEGLKPELVRETNEASKSWVRGDQRGTGEVRERYERGHGEILTGTRISSTYISASNKLALIVN
ncbi:predicted protein [Sclerotinia sclerotiorum 1980 UF-70]|uniref:Uncharacterized protein n=1 Tax=Sclerotinia sclerotiorum (strain ATCC 18683 / 1980 / Ss-1) TaxID=665079 RepID=A7F7T5_SCLS1|nr:predicted protein [Sclerotinia sclerotiorum 1980 UF-70]EDN98806.1 predicted protein [Sclerotinia sclerotiorum 1980 UF-70]